MILPEFSIVLLIVSVSIGDCVEGRDNRVVGGQYAEPNQFPFVVAILNGGKKCCTGSIIHPSWALTAAHCIYGKKPAALTLFSGVIDTKDAVNRYTVESVFPYPHFIHKTMDGKSINVPYDIGLIKIREHFRENSIRLTRVPPLHSKVTLMGFGMTYSGDQNNTRLKYVNMMLVSEFPDTPDQFLCRGTEGLACSGDSGGPVISEEGQFAVMASGGLNCTEGNAITRIDKYMGWIDQTIRTYN